MIERWRSICVDTVIVKFHDRHRTNTVCLKLLHFATIYIAGRMCHFAIHIPNLIYRLTR